MAGDRKISQWKTSALGVTMCKAGNDEVAVRAFIERQEEEDHRTDQLTMF
jgi:hypothetical protein